MNGAYEYRCSCKGCWACAGRQLSCTCDVEWERIGSGPDSDPDYRAPGTWELTHLAI